MMDSVLARSAGAGYSARPRRRSGPRGTGAFGFGGIAKGARIDRLTTDQIREPLPADAIVSRNYSVLVARSRQGIIDNDYVRHYARLVRINITGAQGVSFQSRAADDGQDGAPPVIDRAACNAIEAAFHEWGLRQNCTVTGRVSWRALEAQAVTGAARDGDFFARVVIGRDAGPWGFALQIIDPLRVPIDMNEILRGGAFVRQGIEFNQFGRAVAYFVRVGDHDAHDQIYAGGRYLRVPASEMIHVYRDELGGQKRGLPWVATALWRLSQVDGFEGAALVNARDAASRSGFFVWQEGSGPNLPDDMDEWSPESAINIDVEAGHYQELAPGLDFKDASPKYPSGEFADFLKSQLRGAAAGLGVAYHSFANDLEGVNFASSRAGILDEREAWKDLQEWLIEAFHAQVFERWLRYALLSGRIRLKSGKALPADKFAKFKAAEWMPRRWTWIDPQKDVAANITARRAGFISTSQIIREQGRDPETVFNQMAEDEAAMRAAGVSEAVIAGALMGSVGGGAPTITAKQDGATASESEDE